MAPKSSAGPGKSPSHRASPSPRPVKPKKSKKKAGGAGSSEEPSAEAAALLAEALARTTIAPPTPDLSDGATAARMFEESCSAAKLGDFDRTLNIIKAAESHVPLLQALLQAQEIDGEEGHTILHQAAWHGSVEGVRELLRFGADALRPNGLDESALEVAEARDNDAAAEVLRTWTEAWSGWDAEGLTALACLYHDDRFTDGAAYLRSIVEAERGSEGSANLFMKPLPSGITMLEIAQQMKTRSCQVLLEAYGAAMPAPTPAGSDESPDDMPDGDWPEDGWVAPAPGYMVCSLCKGRSGRRGRWGRLAQLDETWLQYPLRICGPCQTSQGLAALGDDEGAAGWAHDVVRIVRRPGSMDSAPAMMVHPVLGEIGHV